MDNIAISVKDLSKKYRLYESPQHRLKEALHPFRRKYHRDFWALKDISFEVKKGEVVGIIGRNGSGKSTLLQIIAGTLTPTSGQISVDGRVAALLELGSGFNPEFTGRQNVYMNGAVMGLTSKEIDARFQSIADFADIGEFIDQPVKTYSSGMYVRLAFAAAVCVDPEILIVDEALSVGDMAFQQKCFERLRTLKDRGITILFVTHDIMLTRNYCENVIYLKNGNIVLVADAETAGEVYIKEIKEEAQKPVFTSNKSHWSTTSLRSGDTDGKITAIEVTTPDSRLPVCIEGEMLVIRIRANVKKSIAYPRIYVQIRDFRGYILYGVHTMPHDLERIEKGERIELSATLSMKVTLGPGDYGVTAAINNAPGEMTQTILDKQVGVGTFTVLPKTGIRTFHGVVNLNSIWETTSGSKTFESHD